MSALATVGFRQPGLLQLHDPNPDALPSDNSYGAREIKRLADLLSLTAGTYAAHWERWTGPGAGTQPLDSFSERWTRASFGGGYTCYAVPATDVVARCLKIGDTSGSFAGMTLVWNARLLFTDTADEKWAMSMQLKNSVGFVDSAFNDVRIGTQDNTGGGNYTYFGVNGGIDPHKWGIQLGGGASPAFVVANPEINNATFSTMKRLTVSQMPVAGSRTAIVYVDDVEVQRRTLAGTNNNRTPMWSINKGLYYVANWCCVWQAALS